MTEPGRPVVLIEAVFPFPLHCLACPYMGFLSSPYEGGCGMGRKGEGREGWRGNKLKKKKKPSREGACVGREGRRNIEGEAEGEKLLLKV